VAYIAPAGGSYGGAAAAAAPGTGGMSLLLPLLLPLLMSFGPSIISKLFFGDPQAKLRYEIQKLLSAKNLGKVTGENYQQTIGSPAYSQAQGTIAQGANQTANLVAQHLGAAGIGTTGTGAVLSSLTPSLVGSQQAGLRTSAYNQAQQTALEQIKQQIAALTGTQGPSQSQQLFAGGLSAFAPYIEAWLRSRYPDLAIPRTA